MKLPLSLIERIAVTKMTILLKVNYLFSMIPGVAPLDSIRTTFYWKNKKSRIKPSTLQKQQF